MSDADASARIDQAESGTNPAGAAASAPTKRPLKPRRKRNDMVWSPSASHPKARRRITLKSEYAKRVFEDGFERTMHALYELEVMMTVLGLSKKERDAVDTTIEAKFSGHEGDVEASIAQMGKLLQDLRDAGSLVVLDDYTQPYEGDAYYYSPSAGRYLDLVLRMDHLLGLVDLLWIANRLKPEQRFEATIGWQRRLMKFGRDIQDLHIRARSALNREKSVAKRKKGATAEDTHDDHATTVNGAGESTPDDPFDSAPAAKPRATRARKKAPSDSTTREAKPDDASAAVEAS